MSPNHVGMDGEYLHEVALFTLCWACLYWALRRWSPELDEPTVAKQVSLVHAHVAFLLGLWWLAFADDGHSLAEPWTRTFWNTEQALRINSVTAAYMIYDMHAALRFHRPFILHHVIAIVGIVGTHIFGRGACMNVHNIFCAEVGGIFFHVDRLTPASSPQKALTKRLFLFFVGVTRLFYFPYISYNALQALFHGECEKCPVHGFCAVALLCQLGLSAVNLNWFRTNVLQKKVAVD